MAAKKSKQYPYQWPDGSWHSNTWAQHLAALEAAGKSDVSMLPSVTTQKVPPQDPATLALNQPRLGEQMSIAGAPTAAVGGDGAQPQPEDPFLAAQRLAATNNITLGDAESAWQQGQLQRQSGFDATGNLVTTGADFNPFSQAMQLQDAYHANRLGNTNSYAAQGQLYSGALQNAQGAADTGYARGYDALKTATLGGYHGIQAGRLGNYATNSLGTGTADFTLLYKQLYGG